MRKKRLGVCDQIEMIVHSRSQWHRQGHRDITTLH